MESIDQEFTKDDCPRPKVSVIIPVYNAAPYIGRCARSLFGQTLKEIEFIFIDDCTPDNSFDILESVMAHFPERASMTKILRNSSNTGVSATRQRGVDEAAGEYIIHCDPDDSVEPDAYRTLYERAAATGADIVVCDYRTSSSPEPLSAKIPDSKSGFFNAVTHGRLDNFLWNRLMRADFLRREGARFNPGLSLWEDQAYLIPLMMSTDRIEHIATPLYRYTTDNKASISGRINLGKVLSRVEAVRDVERQFEFRGWTGLYAADMAYWKFMVKYDLLKYDPGASAAMWRHTFPEVNGSFMGMPIAMSHKIFCLMAKMRLGLLVKTIRNLRN